MVINFPSASVGQTYQTGSSATYIWNGSYWDIASPAGITVTNATSASLSDTASYAITASYAANGGGGGAAFPFTGSAGIQGELSNGLNAFVSSGSKAHAQGIITSASGLYSHAEGSAVTASGYGSHAEGSGSKALGSGSHAEGFFTTALGAYSHAEGFQTTASATYSHAEGDRTQATNTAAHSEGIFTTARASYSHAEGSGSGVQSTATAASVHGVCTTASAVAQTIVGQYNQYNNTAVGSFVIGNGVSNTIRRDLLRTSGSQVEITGSLVSSGSTTFIGANTVSGSFNVSGSLTVSGTLTSNTQRSAALFGTSSVETRRCSIARIVPANSSSIGLVYIPTQSFADTGSDYTNFIGLDYTLTIGPVNVDTGGDNVMYSASFQKGSGFFQLNKYGNLYSPGGTTYFKTDVLGLGDYSYTTAYNLNPLNAGSGSEWVFTIDNSVNPNGPLDLMVYGEFTFYGMDTRINGPYTTPYLPDL